MKSSKKSDVAINNSRMIGSQTTEPSAPQLGVAQIRQRLTGGVQMPPLNPKVLVLEIQNRL